MKFTQIEVEYVPNSSFANDHLRKFQLDFPNRKIINVNIDSNNPSGWFMTIVYEVEV